MTNEANVDKKAGGKKKSFKVLAIDGGGVRGVIPAILLQELQKELEEPIWKYFDLICGTSTGGIIALGLSVGKSIDEIVKLYNEKSARLFPKIKGRAGNLKKIFKILIGNGARFNADNLCQILKEEFTFEKKYLKIKDAQTRVCIPAIDITNGRIVVYKTPHSVIYPTEQKLTADAEKELWQVALATSAAPTFFRAAKVLDSYLIDGGIWANNPSLVGLTEAIRSGFSLEEISILSLGTGNGVFQVEEKRAKRMNFRNWRYGPGLVELAFETQSQAVHNQVRALLRDDRYFRVQHTFKTAIGLDDVSRLGDLRGAAYNLSRDCCYHIKARFFGQLAENPYK